MDTILELAAIPKGKTELQEVLRDARRTRRRSRLTYWAAGNIVVWSLLILVFWRPGGHVAAKVQPTPTPVVKKATIKNQRVIYLPGIHR